MKRLLSILLCAVLLCTLLPCAALADAGPLALSSQDGGELTVELTASAKQVIAAAYQNGRFCGFGIESDCTPGTYCFSLPESYQYRVFALDDQSAPVCEALDVKNDAAVVLCEEEDVSVPTLDDSVAAALGAAVSEYAKISLALQQIQSSFADEDAFAELEGDSELYQQYNRMLSEAIDALQGTMPSLTALDATTQNQIDEITAQTASAVRAMKFLRSSDEVISWAEDLTKQFDALKGNHRVQQLAKNMGCDAKTAYAALTAAQEALYNRYNAAADSYQNWENAMIAVKATSKVAFFVCATAATAGATTIAAVPAALSTGTVSVAGAAGITVGGADVMLELGMDSAKIILGSSSGYVQRAEDRLKPVTDGLLLYSLCTLNTANAAERLAFIGDVGQRAKELYDNITLSDDGNGNIKGKITRLNSSDPSAAAEVAEMKGLPAGEDTLDATPDEALEALESGHGKSREELTELLKEEGIIEEDSEFTKLIIDFNEAAVEEVNRKNDDEGGGGGGGGSGGGSGPGGSGSGGGSGYSGERIAESYDQETGELTRVTCYDSGGRMRWTRSYSGGKVASYVTYEWDENGDQIIVNTRYLQDEVTGIYTTQIDWIEKTKRIGGSYSNEKRLDFLDYNDNGTIGEHQYYDLAGNWHNEQYDGSGQISTDTIYYPDRTYQLSYYTSNDPNVPGVDRIGHLQHEYEYPKIPENDMFVSVYTVRKEWTAVKRPNYADRVYEYGWYCSVWGGGSVETSFELISTVPMPEE